MENTVSQVIYGLAALLLTILKFAEAIPGLNRYLPIGGSFFYEVGVIFGPAVIIDQALTWFHNWPHGQ
jgi:hypothetical protein